VKTLLIIGAIVGVAFLSWAPPYAPQCRAIQHTTDRLQRIVFETGCGWDRFFGWDWVIAKAFQSDTSFTTTTNGGGKNRQGGI